MIPMNEQGTIVLFSKLADEMGYVFKRIGTGCPDATLEKDGQRVRVEFEHKSSNFRRHKHNPDNVDLIICWEDDWPTSSVPVLCLETYTTLTRQEPKRPWWLRFFKWQQRFAVARYNHRLAIQKAKKTSCKYCEGQIHARCVYHAHINEQGCIDGRVEWRCNACGYITTEPISYHAPLANNPSPFTCSYCNATFSSQQALAGHANAHRRANAIV